jgi:phage virion morphogenesis protein
MAGAAVEITLDDHELGELLDRMSEFGGAPLRLALADIGEYNLRATRERAKEEVTPEGIPWVELSWKYKAYKDKKRPGVPKLKFDFHMLGDMLSSDVGEDQVDTGTNAPYGALHQWGGTSDMPDGPAQVPARKWLGASDDDVDEMGRILADHLEAAILD